MYVILVHTQAMYKQLTSEECYIDPMQTFVVPYYTLLIQY